MGDSDDVGLSPGPSWRFLFLLSVHSVFLDTLANLALLSCTRINPVECLSSMAGYTSAVTWWLVKCRDLGPAPRPMEYKSQDRERSGICILASSPGAAKDANFGNPNGHNLGSGLRLSLTCCVALGNQLLSLIPVSVCHNNRANCIPHLVAG